jgi:hypothetical protein
MRVPDRTAGKANPKGRRVPAPPRRVPPPANDNLPPSFRRLQRLALAVLAVAVAAAGVISVTVL